MPRTSGATATLSRDGTSNTEEMTMSDRSTGIRVFVPMLGVGLLAGLGASTASAQDCGVTRDLALVNGQIYQMNEADSTASSVLIKNGRVAAINPTLDDDACVDTIDLQGRVVIPGLIDNHIHYVRIANRPGYDTRSLETTFTIAAALGAIEARATEVPAGELITTIGGIRRSQWTEDRFPTRDAWLAASDELHFALKKGNRLSRLESLAVAGIETISGVVRRIKG